MSRPIWRIADPENPLHSSRAVLTDGRILQTRMRPDETWDFAIVVTGGPRVESATVYATEQAARDAAEMIAGVTP